MFYTILCSMIKDKSRLCQACQLGHHINLPFSWSSSLTINLPFNWSLYQQYDIVRHNILWRFISIIFLLIPKWHTFTWASIFFFVFHHRPHVKILALSLPIGRGCSCFKNYLIVLYDYTHFVWLYPLRAKCETFQHLSCVPWLLSGTM
jgi:hypothetical protein